MNEFEQLIENDKQISSLIEQNEKLFNECFELIYEADPNQKSYQETIHKAIELKAKRIYKRCAVGEYYQTKHCIYKRIK